MVNTVLPSPVRLSSLLGLLLSMMVLTGPATADTGSRVPDRGPETSKAVAETFRQKNGSVFVGWSRPLALLVITGELNGYIEPCGCTGKENQKGGLRIRRVVEEVDRKSVV